MNVDNFPSLKDYLEQAVGTLPSASFLREALDCLFTDYAHLQTIQEDIYSIIKLYLSEHNHPDVNQFQDICMHDNKVSGDRVPVTKQCIIEPVKRTDNCDVLDCGDKPLDLSNTRADDTFYSTASQGLTEQLSTEQSVYRTSSCPHLEKGLDYKPQLPLGTEKARVTPLSPPQENIDTTHHNSDHTIKEPECKENPLRASTPTDTIYNKPLSERLKEIIYHTPALHIPPVNLTVAPGQAPNIQVANQRLAAMAQPPQRGRARLGPLQGADPALVQIIHRMEDRDNNRDLSRKKLLMFPKNMFNGNTKGLAKSHWLEFKKYLDYQKQQGFMDPTDPNSLPEIKQMFRMTLNDNALGWYDADHTNWTSIQQMQQAFLKRFNIWGDTKCQQQDSWNKLRFNMVKDDVDTFVTDMRTLASILGHNEEVLAEKFKDIFPDKNIEAALIAMDNLEEMQAKAKQLVQI